MDSSTKHSIMERINDVEDVVKLVKPHLKYVTRMQPIGRRFAPSTYAHCPHVTPRVRMAWLHHGPPLTPYYTVHITDSGEFVVQLRRYRLMHPKYEPLMYQCDRGVTLAKRVLTQLPSGIEERDYYRCLDIRRWYDDFGYLEDEHLPGAAYIGILRSIDELVAETIANRRKKLTPLEVIGDALEEKVSKYLMRDHSRWGAGLKY